MLFSDTTPTGVHLTVDAGNPTTEIFIINTYFDRIAKGLGRIETELAPGIYKVKFKAGLLIREVYVTLEPGSIPITVTPPDNMPFSTSAPIPNTRTTHEYHEKNARQLSNLVHRAIGEGSQLFVFVRDLNKEGWGDPATDLTLHDLAGNLLVDFTVYGEREIHNPNLDHWAGCTIKLDPGAYRLRARTGTAGSLEQIVVTSSGWQTQVFLLRRPHGDWSDLRGADLCDASILMSQIGLGFQLERPDLRQTELARQGLANRRIVMDAREMNKLLLSKYENPMLGIYGAHLMLLAQKPDRALLRLVTDHLHDLVGDHPDVTALDVWLGKAFAQYPVYQAPPMLNSSWEILVKASIDYPNIIPSGSLAARIADHLWCDSAWLVWQEPAIDDVLQQPKTVDPLVLRDFLPQIVDVLGGTISREQIAKVAQASNLNNLEQSLLEYATKPALLKGPIMLPSESSASIDISEELPQTLNTAHLDSKALIEAFGLPNAVIGEAAAGLIEKIEKMNLKMS